MSSIVNTWWVAETPVVVGRSSFANRTPTHDENQPPTVASTESVDRLQYACGRPGTITGLSCNYSVSRGPAMGGPVRSAEAYRQQVPAELPSSVTTSWHGNSRQMRWDGLACTWQRLVVGPNVLACCKVSEVGSIQWNMTTMTKTRLSFHRELLIHWELPNNNVIMTGRHLLRKFLSANQRSLTHSLIHHTLVQLSTYIYL